MLAAVERRPSRASSVSRKSAPQSITTVSVGQRLRRARADWPCGSAEEDHVVAGERLDRGLLEDPVGQRHQVRLERAERLPGVGAGGHRADLDVGVAEQQPEHLAAGVPAGAGDRGCAFRHVHDYTLDLHTSSHRVPSTGRPRPGRGRRGP